MSDRLDDIRAGLRDGRYDCRVPGDTDDVRWLVAEVKRLRQRLEDVNIKDAAKTAEINILTAENRKLCERKAWYGDYLDLRERHAEAVKSAYIEGRNSDEFDAADKFIEDEYSWLASEARRQLEEGR